MRVPAAAGWAGRLGWVVPIRARQIAAPVAVTKSAAPGHVQAVAILTSPDDRKVVLSAAESSSTVISASPMPEAVGADSDGARSAWREGLHWPAPGLLIAMIYLVVSVALFLRLVWGLGVALRLWVTADLVSPLVAPEPNVRSSSKIPSPVTIGSGIVLPASYTEWDRKKLRMVLAHERSHVRQLDFYLQLLAGLYTALFWFSPLGWWLRRTLSSLGEAIGDRAGIDAAASRSGYAEILLEFAAMPRQTLPGVAMARPGNLSRRIERLLNEHLFRSAFAEGRRRAWVSLLLIPAALFAATVLVRVPGAAAQTAPAAPAPAPGAPASPAAVPAGQTAPAPPAVAPQNPTAPVPPAAPAAAPPDGLDGTGPTEPPPADGEATGYLADGNTVTVHGPHANIIVDKDGVHGFAYHFSEDGDSYAVVDPSETSYSFSGEWSQDRKEEIDAARKVAKGPFLWFTHDDKAYVVDDPAIVAKIRAMYKPMEELGRQQEELGRKQEELGKQQEELARQEEEAGDVRMPDLSKEIADLDAAVARFKEDRDQLNTKQLAEAEASLKAAQNKVLSPEKMSELQEALSAAQAEWSSERIAEMQAKLAELQARLGELQGASGSRQGAFGAKMGALGAQQGVLGSEQGRLGAEEGKLAREADRQVRSIINDCLHSGKATEVPFVK